jgi:ParB family chromosome partitioning protein
MLKSNQYQHEIIGIAEEISIVDIIPSSNILRVNGNDVQELTDSINKIGLLAPVIVRSSVSGKFEIIAGNRRLKACKKLGWRRVPCFIVDFDDKTAFEASLVENIQRHTLNILEEGLAFKKYVTDFGWGGVSELARRLSKSTSYVSKRIRLLDLPEGILHLICESDIPISTGEELLSLDDKSRQSQLASLVVNHRLSSKKLRSILKQQESLGYGNDFNDFKSETEDKQKRILHAFDKSIVALRVTLAKLAASMEKVQDEWIIFETLMYHKNSINSQIDLLIRERRRFIKGKNIICK